MAWAVSQVFLKWTCEDFEPLDLHDFLGFLGQLNSKPFLEVTFFSPGRRMEAAWCLELLEKTWTSRNLRALAAFLKKFGKLKVPERLDTVKLAKHKELAPYNENWSYTRAASIAQHLYLQGRWAWPHDHDIWRGIRGMASCPATSAEVPRVWPIRSSKPCRAWKWGKRTKMGAANWHLRKKIWTESPDRWQLATSSIRANDPGLINCLIP